jgi:hypothetical protein
MAGCQITEMQCMWASLALSGHEILVLSICALVLFRIIDRAGAQPTCDTLRDQRRKRRRVFFTDNEPRCDAPRPRGPSSAEHISAKGVAAKLQKRHDPADSARVYHRRPDRSEDCTRSGRLVEVVGSHATVISSGDCDRPKPHHDCKGSHLATGFSQTTSRDALTTVMPLRISSSIRQKETQRSIKVMVPGSLEPNDRWKQDAEEPPETLANLAQLTFNRSAPTVMVHAERPAAERPAAERPATGRTASFARMIENTRETPKTPGTPPTPISLRLRPESRVTQRISLREYPAKK